FENACKRYFQVKKVAKDEHIVEIIYNFKLLAVQAWIMTHHDHLIKLTFKVFITEFKNKFLPANWKDNLIATQITMQSSQAFLTWMEGVCEANAEIRLHIVEDKLRMDFIPCLSPALKASYDANNTHGTLDAITDLEAWIQCMHLLDLENQNKREEWLKITQSMACTNNKGNAGCGGGGPSSSGATGTTMTGVASMAVLANTMNTTNATQPVTPKLTQVEHDLLRAHHGCFRCRLFYAGHYAPKCPLGTNGRPTAEACKSVTITAALKVKTPFEGKGSTVVATVFEDGEESDDFEITGNEANEYVQTPRLPPHLWWNCCINAPLTCASTPICVLIDHGSPPVLISSELIDVLGLPRRKLFKLFSVSGALVNGQREVDSSLTEYCKLHLQSPDSVWKSKVVNAVISLNLYTKIIMGLDFLAQNRIVVDVELRTAIAKSDGYDLLNLPEAKPWATPCLPHKCHNTDAKVLQIAIRKCIGELSGQLVLEKLDSVYKDCYSDRFPTDIPHAKDLPMNVYHHIEVKPGAPISVGRAYSCPRKYCEGWKTLIEQHSKAR
ncbi:hypothetical protein L208DRAFT_1254475, partial [Tricholoma matsutake]